MAKPQTVFYCQSCGAKSLKWIGKCPSCNEWNTYVEEIVTKPSSVVHGISSSQQRAAKPRLLSEINIGEEHRIPVIDNELNRVLGGGIVPGSFILVGGEPGIGKSTLLLQLAVTFNSGKVLYISGEESAEQILMRAKRLGTPGAECFILNETSTQHIFKQIEQLQPSLVIIDSIQTLHTSFIESSPGSVSQIRETASEFLKYAKESGTPVLVIGHITKDGMIAGPKILEHMADTVLQFEGDRHHVYRLLRTLKNRFGSASEIGIYEMTGTGMKEVSNPSEFLISSRDENISGSTIGVTLEGIRPMLIETQALVSSAVYGTPQRSSTGFELRRLSMLLAVLEKRCNFRIGAQDVFLNITGGIRVEDPAIDLAVVCAVLSSAENVAVSSKICFSAEVGLSGEIRPVSRIEQRISEAEKLGFTEIYISKYNMKGIAKLKSGIKIIPVSKIEEVYTQLFG